MAGRFRKFIALSRGEKKMLAEALLFQITAGFLLKILPFRKIPRFFPGPSKLSGSVTAQWQVREALQRSAVLSPWRNRCLVSSLAARWMLSRRGIESQVFLGMTGGSHNKLTAHAWIKAADIEIVEKSGDYYELFVF